MGPVFASAMAGAASAHQAATASREETGQQSADRTRRTSAELQSQPQQSPRANNTGLPDQLKIGIESLSGLSMDDVRVHYNSSQPAQLNALAYAQGSDIHLAPGQEQHLPHEAWHVVQQAHGRVRQRRLAEAIYGSPRMTAQRRLAAAIGAVPRLLKAGPAVAQLRKYRDAEIRELVKEAKKSRRPNRVAILLEVYNQMRFEVDPTPPTFSDIRTARQAMVAANRLDDEDAAALDVEATRLQRAGGNPAEAFRLRIRAKIEETRDAVEGRYGPHIFQGHVKGGIPTGFHSKADVSATHETYGGITDIATSAGGNRVYQQSVRLQNQGTIKPIQSTFFPDAATHTEVIEAIAAVYEAGLAKVAHVAPTVNELILTKRGDTVFPAGGSDTRVAE